MIELEDAVMEIIVNAGQSRSLCFEALHAARTGNIDEARLLLNEADGYARRAHQMQTQLIGQDAGEEDLVAVAGIVLERLAGQAGRAGFRAVLEEMAIDRPQPAGHVLGHRTL